MSSDVYEEEEEFSWYKFAVDCLIANRVLDILEESDEDINDYFSE